MRTLTSVHHRKIWAYTMNESSHEATEARHHNKGLFKAQTMNPLILITLKHIP